MKKEEKPEAVLGARGWGGCSLHKYQKPNKINISISFCYSFIMHMISFSLSPFFLFISLLFIIILPCTTNRREDVVANASSSSMPICWSVSSPRCRPWFILFKKDEQKHMFFRYKCTFKSKAKTFHWFAYLWISVSYNNIIYLIWFALFTSYPSF